MSKEENEHMRKLYAKWEESGVDDKYYRPNKPKRRFTALLSRKW